MRRTKARQIVPSLCFAKASCDRRKLQDGPDILLRGFWACSSLRVGIEQEQLPVGDPVSGSGAAERYPIEDGSAMREIMIVAVARKLLSQKEGVALSGHRSPVGSPAADRTGNGPIYCAVIGRGLDGWQPSAHAVDYLMRSAGEIVVAPGSTK